MSNIESTTKKDGRGQFFAVENRIWPLACRLGLVEAAAYLTICCGTGPDNKTSNWSAQAVSKYTGVTHLRAQRAIDSLAGRGILQRHPSSTAKKPRYLVARPHEITGCIDPCAATKPRWIWLPCQLVVGAASEIPPVRLLRQTQDVRTLRLLIEMYDQHLTHEHGGIDPSKLMGNYQRQKLATYGPFVVWTFEEKKRTAALGSSFVKQFLAANGNPIEEKGRWIFWQHLDQLLTLGLVQEVPHLFDGPPAEDGQLLHPLSFKGHGLDAEIELAEAASDAADAMLAECYQSRLEQGCQDTVAPVLAHIAQVQLVGIFRLRYLPKTSTNARFIERNDEWRALTERFKTLGKRNEALVSR